MDEMSFEERATESNIAYRNIRRSDSFVVEETAEMECFRILPIFTTQTKIASGEYSRHCGKNELFGKCKDFN